jgi:hypothetical protein
VFDEYEATGPGSVDRRETTFWDQALRCARRFVPTGDLRGRFVCQGGNWVPGNETAWVAGADGVIVICSLAGVGPVWILAAGGGDGAGTPGHLELVEAQVDGHRYAAAGPSVVEAGAWGQLKAGHRR